MRLDLYRLRSLDLGGEPAEDGNGLSNGLKSPLLIVAVTFFLAELGDKTMLGTATLATQYPFLPVWLAPVSASCFPTPSPSGWE